jgi:hypothetical protein
VRPVLAFLLLVPTPARADVLTDDARATGHLFADDDVLLDRAWLTPQLGSGTLGIATTFSFGRFTGPNGTVVRFGFDLVVQIPIERLLQKKEPVMKRNRWSAAVALPSAIAIASLAKGKPNTAPIPAGSVSARALIEPSASASTAPSTSITAPLVIQSLSPNAVRTLVAAAWKLSGVERDDALSDLAARARASALAPEVRLRAYRGIDAGARIYRVEDSDRATVSDGTQSVFEARLSWRLDRLVFADEEVAIERIRLERAELKQRISSKVLDLLLRFQRARRAANDEALLAHEREEAALVAVESLIALDALTGGAASPLLMRSNP